MRVKYVDTPQGATPQFAGDAQSFTDWQQLGKTQPAYATLEPMGWPLDGSRQLLPDSPKTAYWSSSTREGFVSLSFPKSLSATAVTVVFSPNTGEWCSGLELRWYRGNDLLAKAVSQPTASTWVVERVVEGFDRLELKLSQPNLPGHFPKLQQVAVGKELWFDASQLARIRLVNEIDPLLSKLTEDTMTLSVENVPVPLLPQKNQKLELYRGEELLSVQYLESCSRERGDSYTFSCRSAIGLLEEEFMGGMYENTPAASVLAEVLEGFDYELLELENATLTGYLPITTRREALQHIAFALGAVVSTQGDGVIRVSPQKKILAAPFEAKDIFEGSSLVTQPAVSRVEVIAHRYTPGSGKQALLQDEPVFGENLLFSFSQPHHSYEITGGSLTEVGANHVRITANGPVTLTAGEYLHTQTSHVRQASESGEQSRSYTVDSATLIHSGNAQNVLNRLYAAAALRQTLTQEVAVKGQRAGQTVTSQSPWGTLVQGYLTAMDSDLTRSGHTARVTVLGSELKWDGFGYAGQLYAGEKEALP